VKYRLRYLIIWFNLFGIRDELERQDDMAIQTIQNLRDELELFNKRLHIVRAGHNGTLKQLDKCRGKYLACRNKLKEANDKLDKCRSNLAAMQRDRDSLIDSSIKILRGGK
jgi:chromosome segregation ATPase